jgi:hypothetical protein
MWKLALTLALLTLGQSSSAPVDDSDLLAKAQAQVLAKKVELCPPRDVVGPSSGKHHKWFKNRWGAPTDSFASVKRTDDLLHPYELTVEFSLPVLYGDEKSTEEEARADTNLLPLPSPFPQNKKSRNRNVYLWGKSELVLKSREVFYNSPFSQTPPAWGDRPPWPDACWDWVGTDKEFKTSK